jgi:hypothetical protein
VAQSNNNLFDVADLICNGFEGLVVPMPTLPFAIRVLLNVFWPAIVWFPAVCTTPVIVWDMDPVARLEALRDVKEAPDPMNDVAVMVPPTVGLSL